jgi:acetoacetyl-CoA reductase
MTGRVALVTGGTRGIGAGISRELKDAGYRVAANFAGNEKRASEFEAETGIPVFKFDAGDFDAVQRGVAEVVERVGPIEVLVNNAGITRDSTLHKMTFQQWEEVIRTNLTSCFNLCRTVIESMRERRFGRIVNVGSVNGQAGQYGQVNYAASKSGMHGFTKALALESAAYGITVNAVAPGYVNTEMVQAVPEKVLEKIIQRIPMGRLGEPHDIVRAIFYLVSDEADFITGSTVSVNGGQHMY